MNAIASKMPGFDPQALLRPDAFPHAVERLLLRETHISWIVLTGPFAYKIKKPVKFDFIDASTLDLRRRLCDEEVRLNRRFAPELYIDVQPIALRDGRATIGGGGTVVEYAVRMRQFSEADELLSLLRSDSVATTEIAALADSIAEFHSGARALRPLTGEAPEDPAAVVLENSAELSLHLGKLDPVQSLDDVIQWTKRNAHALNGRLRDRRQSGSVRECHGDLHAGNIVRFNGSLVPFDCIDFNPELRNIDVIDDIAFLFMDLISHAREDFAFVLINAYLEKTGDYAGLALLRFYSVYRALVRAKVDVLALEQAFGDVGRTTRLRDRINTARQLTQPTGKPILILMHGVSGSGKSWLSERMVGRVPAIRVRSDVERKRLANRQSVPTDTDELYSSRFNDLTYRRVLECTEECLAAGFNCIADATFLDYADRKRFHALAARLGIPHVILSCEAPYSSLATRVMQRGVSHRDASDADLAVLHRQLDSLEPIEVNERQFLIPIDTTGPEAVDAALEKIRVRRR